MGVWRFDGGLSNFCKLLEHHHMSTSNGKKKKMRELERPVLGAALSLSLYLGVQIED